nr:hypothetical protein [uncultured Cohaesibacter sp.]
MFVNLCLMPVYAHAQSNGAKSNEVPSSQAYTSSNAQSLNIELNYVEDFPGGCRLTFLVNNQSGTSLDKLAYEFVILDEQGQAVDFVELEFDAILKGKLRAYRFDMEGRSCDQISQLLINDLLTCETPDGASDVCLQKLNPSSRIAGIKLQ